jgi:hypothetical protein
VKKLLVILLALCVVSGAFAQATVNGYVRALQTYSDAGGIALQTRVRLNLSYTTEEDLFKAYARLETSDYAAPVVKYAYARVNLLDNKVILSGGMLMNSDYEFASGISDLALGNVANDSFALDAAKAVLLQVLPVEGLNIGVAAFAGLGTIDQVYAAAKYDIADVGALVVDSRLATDLADSRVSAAFQFTGVEGLAASAGYKYHSDMYVASLTESTVFGIINYATGDVTVEVAPEYRLDSGKLYVEGYVNYVMGDFTTRLLGAYDAASSADTIGAEYLVRLEAYYNVGKGQIMAGFAYDDVNTWSIPLIVKVSF